MTVTERKRARSPHQPVGRWIRPDKRLAIYLRDGMRCLACGLDLHGARIRDITLDHVILVSAGGSNHESNLYTCCRSCNSSRGAKPLHMAFGPHVLADIRRCRRRSLKRYRALARAFFGQRPARPRGVKINTARVEVA